MDNDKFEINGMDRRSLGQFRVDIDNPAFRKEYMKARDLWENIGHQRGGLHDATLFAMAMKFQVAEEKPHPKVVSETIKEALSAEPAPQPVKKKTAKKKPVKKQLATA
jgi:hypothetical protein